MVPVGKLLDSICIPHYVTGGGHADLLNLESVLKVCTIKVG